MRVWITKDGVVNDDDFCAVWVELGDGRLMWILNSGKHGFSSDDGEGYSRLSNRLARDPDWELL